MKEELLALVSKLEDPTDRLNLLREYLQACVLRSLHESEAFLFISFVGGTALRFLFELPRFSEELDFSVEDSTGYTPEKWMGKIHALVTRSYSKGRDWYDLAWYRAKRPPISPNLVLLQAALDQTQGAGVLRADDWKQHVRARLALLTDEELGRDAGPFLERRQDVEMLSIENLLSLL